MTREKKRSLWKSLSRRRNKKLNRIHSRRFLRGGFEQLEDRRLLAAFEVTSLSNSGDGTLRDAIAAAEANAEADVITFASDLTAAGDATISLTSRDTGTDAGEFGPTSIFVSTDISIIGPTGENGITLQRLGSSAFRLFHVTSTGTLTLENLTLTNGKAQGFSGGAAMQGGTGGGSAGLGGAIFNQGYLTIRNSTLAGNEAIGGAGGNVYESGSKPGGGGGAGLGSDGQYNSGGGSGGLPDGGDGGGCRADGDNGGFGSGGGGGGSSDCSGSGNVGGDGGDGGFGGGGGGGGEGNDSGGAGGRGGFGGGDGAVGSTSNGDTVGGGGGAGMGGAIFNHAGFVTITNSTISGNTAQGGNAGTGSGGNGQGGAGYGGGLFNRDGQVTILNSTFASNTVTPGSGSSTDDGGSVYQYNDAGGANPSLTVDNSIFADSSSGAKDVFVNGGSVTGSQSNLVESNSGLSASVIAVTSDPKLGSLTDNGGPTRTHSLQIGSPAIDAGDNATAAGLSADQLSSRPRIIGGTVDIGSFEYLILDWGDAPEPYATTFAEDGSRHPDAGPTLGAARDTELDGSHNSAADSDDTAGDTPDDEDGVTFPASIRVGQLASTVTVHVQGIATTAKLDAWIDFNADGSWGGSTEQIARSMAMTTGDNSLVFDVPANAVSGPTYARFRISKDGGLGPTGLAFDGEVEDYVLTISPPASTTAIFGDATIISTPSAASKSVHAADLDGDGDMDLLSATQDGIVWSENNGSQEFSLHTIVTIAGGATNAIAVDLDEDGDLDILGTLYSSTNITWFENDGEPAPTFTERDIATSLSVPLDAIAADVDGDGDLDVIIRQLSRLLWYENDGGSYAPFTEHVIRTKGESGTAGRRIRALDVDRDGDIDIVDASQVGGVTWFENNGVGSLMEHAVDTTPIFELVEADVDGDLDLDLIATTDYDKSVLLYVNDGNGGFAKTQIGTTAGNTLGAAAFDADGDGDADVVIVESGVAALRWYVNDGSGGFSARTTDNSLYNIPRLVVADLDNDGDLDLAAACRTDPNAIAWYENAPPQPPTITTGAAANVLENQTAVVDIQATDPEGETENGGGLTYSITGGVDRALFSIDSGTGVLTFASTPDFEFPTDDGANNVYDVQITVTDSSLLTGILDLIVAVTDVDEPYDFGDAPSPYPTTLAENGAVHQTTGPTLGAAADLELDGIHSANADSDDANGDTPDDEDGVTFPTAIRVGQLGAPVTVNVQNITTTAKLDAWIDFNGDGSWGGPMERIARGVVMSAGDNTVAFDVPSDAIPGATFARFRLSTAGGLGPAGVADDGEVEDYPVIIATSTASSGAFGSQITISTEADFPGSVFAADMDGDGDTDVLSASELDDKIAWYENDGSQNFTAHTINTSADRATSVFAADVDGDGDMDVLSASGNDKKIAWYENDGSQNFAAHTISTNATYAWSVFAADVDRDGDLDVLSASYLDDKIAWYENDGDQNFTAHTISTAADGARSVFAADLDGDGDVDVLSASELDDKIAWYENDGSQNFTTHTISNTADGARSVFAADVDGDGDLDVLSASRNDNTISWFENDGSQNFSTHSISTAAGWALAVFAADVDGDGDLDVLSASSSDDKIAWYENGPSTGNQSPTITTDDSANAAENQTSVVDIAATDPDGETENGGGLTYALTGGADQAKFSINSGTGVLTFKSAPNYESPTDNGGDNVYNVQVTVTDSGGLTDVLDLAVTVTNVNEGVTITTDETTSVVENQTAVVDVESIDDDGETENGGGLTYGITGGVDQAKFSINANSGELAFNTAPDFESPTDDGGNNVYDVQITVTDGAGLNDVLDLAVTVTGENETPSITTGATISVAENQTVVVDLESTDPDGETESGGGLSYEITGGADQSAFQVDAATGELTFKTAPDFEAATDDGTNNVYDVQVTVTDAAGSTGLLGVAVTVTNVNESPTITTVGTVSVSENQTAVVDLAATDPDGESENGGGLTYSVTGGADQGEFSINAATGELAFKTPPNFESPTDNGGNNVYNVQLTVTDAGGLTNVLALAVTVTNENESPAITTGDTISAAENQTAVVDLASVDGDGETENGGGLTYSITGGEDQSAFDVDAATGVLTFKTAPDFESPADGGTDNVYHIQLTVTDTLGLTGVMDLAVTVTNVNESPTITSGGTISVTENQTAVVDLASTDLDGESENGGGLTYSITGGADQSAFAINEATGELTFKTAPDYESPTDNGGNNVYNVQVTVADAGGLTDALDLAVTITDVAEGSPDPPDVTPPTSKVVDLPRVATSKSISINVTGHDVDAGDGRVVSGIASYDIYLLVDNGPFTLWQAGVTPAEFPLTYNVPECNHRYGFRSVAKDAAGNVETEWVDLDATTWVPDLDPPVSEVKTVDATTAKFSVKAEGVDVGLGMVASFEFYVQVDGGPVEKFATVPAAISDTDCTYHATASYQAKLDDAEHDYRFYSIGIDDSGNREAAPGDGLDQVVADKTFTAAISNEAIGIDVQQGAKQRSFIRHLDVLFSDDRSLNDIIATVNDADGGNDRLILSHLGMDGAGGPNPIDVKGKLSVGTTQPAIQIDFGTNGIGGNPNGTDGNGYYRLEVDMDGDGTMDDEFYFARLLGDADGSGKVDTADYDLVMANLWAEGVSDGDLNGDGIVNGKDRGHTMRQKTELTGTITLDD